MSSFDLTGITYFPTLGIRPAEMRGLEELPESTKDRLRPLVLYCPWVGAKKLDAATQRLHNAIGDRPFYLEMDSGYSTDTADREAVIEFVNAKDDLDAYFDLVTSISSAIPVLRVEGHHIGEIEGQLDFFGGLGRGFAVRIRRSVFPNGNLTGLSALFESGRSDYVLFLDCEWSRDIVSCELWCGNCMRWFVESEISVPLVPMLSSFPRTFADVVGLRSIDIPSRILFRNLHRRFSNRQPVIYGDWATTKPRDDSHGRLPPPRIDYATANQWVIARNKDVWDYRDAAQALITSSFWNADLHIWGGLQIEKTAAGDPTGITSPQKNVAARINLHLQQQAWFDDPNSVLETDDPWPDDL